MKAPHLVPALTCFALSALSACGGGADPRLEAGSELELCQQRLRRIYAGLLEYEQRHGRAPAQGGVRLFAALIAEGIWSNTAENVACLSCPGVSEAELGIAATPAAQRFADLARVAGSSSAYAGRDLERWPLARFPGPGTEPLIACDNQLGPNHERHTNVLFADGSVVTLDLEMLERAGLVAPDAERLPIGPEASAKVLRGALRKFSLD